MNYATNLLAGAQLIHRPCCLPSSFSLDAATDVLIARDVWLWCLPSPTPLWIQADRGEIYARLWLQRQKHCLANPPLQNLPLNVLVSSRGEKQQQHLSYSEGSQIIWITHKFPQSTDVYGCTHPNIEMDNIQ